MKTDIQIRDGAFDLAGSTDPVSRPAAAEPISIGDLSSLLCSDLSVRLSGEFQLPKLKVARSSQGGDHNDRA